MDIDDLLRTTVERGGSDLHLKVGSPPLARVHGELLTLDGDPLTQEQARALSYANLTPQQQSRFERDYELDFSYAIPAVARFRGNLYLQRGMVQSVFRVIPLQIRTMEELRLPPVCRYFAERPRGLALVTGAAGAGKSTTLAALIDYINRRSPLHIVTIEDPIEFVHDDKKAVVTQRELGLDTPSFDAALRAALRHDPDVILVGELRDLETIQLALTAAETGHLVFGTMHSVDAIQALERIIDLFPVHQQQQVRMQLSVNLIGVVSQTLVKTKDGHGRVAAYETLVGVPGVRSLIREAKTHQIFPLIQTGMKQGMVTRDQSLANLVKKGVVTYEVAQGHAHSLTEFDFLCTDSDTALDAAAGSVPPPTAGITPVKPSLRLGQSS